MITGRIDFLESIKPSSECSEAYRTFLKGRGAHSRLRIYVQGELGEIFNARLVCICVNMFREFFCINITEELDTNA